MMLWQSFQDRFDFIFFFELCKDLKKTAMYCMYHMHTEIYVDQNFAIESRTFPALVWNIICLEKSVCFYYKLSNFGLRLNCWQQPHRLQLLIEFIPTFIVRLQQLHSHSNLKQYCSRMQLCWTDFCHALRNINVFTMIT